LACLSEIRRGAAEIAGEVEAKEGGFDQPSAAFGGRRTEVGGPGHGGDRTLGIAPPACQVSSGLEERRDLLVGRRGRLTEMPRSALGLIREVLGESLVDASTLVAGRQLDEGGADQRVAEFHSVGAVVDMDDPSGLGWGQVSERLVVTGAGPQDSQLAGPFEHGQQQEVSGRSGELGNPRFEQRLESPAEWQQGGKGP